MYSRTLGLKLPFYGHSTELEAILLLMIQAPRLPCSTLKRDLLDNSFEPPQQPLLQVVVGWTSPCHTSLNPKSLKS